jgi:hypothetical protein
MSLFSDAKETLKKVGEDVLGPITNKFKDPVEPVQLPYPVKPPYSINAKDLSLYTTTSYGFRYYIDKSVFEFWLPINPSNLSIVTNFANSVTPTLYGAIEERSEIKTYSIVISGNTGIAPKNVRMRVDSASTNQDVKPSTMTSVSPGTESSSPGRSGPKTSLINDAGNFIAQNLDFTGFVKKRILPLSQGISDLVGSIFGSDAPSGFKNYNSGYAAFHNFYRFLWTYQKLVGSKTLESDKNSTDPIYSNDIKKRNSSNVKLFFYNYKDKYAMHVSPQRFTLNRSSDSPYVYNYSIELIGLGYYPITGKSYSEDTLQNQLSSLGLDGVRSNTLRGTVSNIAGSIKNITNFKLF